MNTLRSYLQAKSIILLLLVVVFSASCSSQTGKRATQGAATGAAAGAVGGVVSALIFGGNVGEAAARGAVWGGSAGAVSGAIVGAQEDQAIKRQETEQAIAQMKAEFGEDAYAGLVALAQCKHAAALGYADIAQKLDNPDYARAGTWLEVIAYADQKQEDKVAGLEQKLISVDPELQNPGDISPKLTEALQGLTNIRKEHFKNRSCKS